MRATYMTINGKITDKIIAAESDCGTVSAVQVPATTTYGDYMLVETATGRHMACGEYQDLSRTIQQGTMTGERVPAETWEIACALMAEVDAALLARKVEMDKITAARDAKFDSITQAWLAADMDRADSNN